MIDHTCSAGRKQGGGEPACLRLRVCVYISLCEGPHGGKGVVVVAGGCHRANQRKQSLTPGRRGRGREGRGGRILERKKEGMSKRGMVKRRRR